MCMCVYVINRTVCVCVCVCVCVRMCVCVCLCVPLFYYSEFSDSVTYTCAAAAPEAPPTPECVEVGVRHVTVRWSSPDDNGGEHITVLQLDH